MSRAEIAVSIDENILTRLDLLIREGKLPNRNHAIEGAVREKLERFELSRLAEECEKLDPEFEKQLAEEGLAEDFRTWPEY